MKAKYKKETPRITFQFVDSDTEEILFEINDRNWMNIGELFSDGYFNEIIKRELTTTKRKPPKNILALASAEFFLEE